VCFSSLSAPPLSPSGFVIGSAVRDRVTKAKHVLNVMGTRMPVYWTANACFDITVLVRCAFYNSCHNNNSNNNNNNNNDNRNSNNNNNNNDNSNNNNNNNNNNDNRNSNNNNNNNDNNNSNNNNNNNQHHHHHHSHYYHHNHHSCCTPALVSVYLSYSVYPDFKTALALCSSSSSSPLQLQTRCSATRSGNNPFTNV